MNTIAKEVKFKIEIKKSEFICHLKNVYTSEEAQKYIQQIKKQNTSATHNCNAYIVGQEKKADDDGEPSGTAGMPMLNVLEHHDMQNIVCVVTRYFGGIKLGAGGLIRAYAKSVSQTLNTVELIKLIEGETTKLEVTFDVNDSVNYYLKKNKIEIISKEYGTKVIYKVRIPKKIMKEFEEAIKSINHLIKIIKEEDIMMIDYEK